MSTAVSRSTFDLPVFVNLIDSPCCPGSTSTLRRGLGGATPEKQLGRRPTGLGREDTGCQQVCSGVAAHLLPVLALRRAQRARRAGAAWAVDQVHEARRVECREAHGGVHGCAHVLARAHPRARQALRRRLSSPPRPVRAGLNDRTVTSPVTDFWNRRRKKAHTHVMSNENKFPLKERSDTQKRRSEIKTRLGRKFLRSCYKWTILRRPTP